MARAYLDILKASDIRTMAPSVSPEAFVLPDQVGYIKWVFSKFRSIIEDAARKSSTDIPANAITAFKYTAHQRFVRDYLQHTSPYRGLLLFHALGAGKSCASIAAAEMLIKHDKNVVVLLPASLEVNYVGEIYKCGNPSYAPQQRWMFVPKEQFNGVDAAGIPAIDALLKSPKVTGLWIPGGEEGGHKKYDVLTGDEQKAVLNQINAMIKTRYEFVHYNGLTPKLMAGYKGAKNPFDDKVVVIDEVHNFISQVYNAEGKPKNNARVLYECLMNAKNAKLILLSGTPIINKPFEIAYIINLLKGYDKVYTLNLPKNVTSKQVDAVHKVLGKNPRVHRVVVKGASTALPVAEVQLVDGRFVKSMRATVKVGDAYVTDEVALQSVTEGLKAKGITTSLDPRIKYFLPLPTDEEEFNRLFVDDKFAGVVNANLFMRRTLGTVSAVTIPDSGLFPTEETHIVALPMSDYQCQKYMEARSKERVMEDRNAKATGKGKEDQVSVFKTFSRAAGLFAFPKDITRRYPMDIRAFLKEMDMKGDDNADDAMDGGSGKPCPEGKITNPKTGLCVKIDGAIGKAILKAQRDAANKPDAPEAPKAANKPAPKPAPKADVKDKYDDEITAALQKIREGADTYLVQDLAVYSPKYAAMQATIATSPGPVLVYSQYRNVEGLQILGMVLEAHGYSELKVKRTATGWALVMGDSGSAGKLRYIKFTGDKEETEVLLSIYNWNVDTMPASIQQQLKDLGAKSNLHGETIKVLMITQSGAEGISLRNVRQVHVMEPYWNQNRVKQVIGRASRMNSHMQLPEPERRVDVFLYVSKFTPKQLDENITARRKDDSLTSDQQILATAQRKDRLVQSFLDLLKRASVDCLINNVALPKAHKVKCFTYPVGLPAGFIGAWDLANEKALDTESGQGEAIRPIKVQIKRDGGVVTYLYVPKTLELFDWAEYEAFGVLTRVGYLRKKDADTFKLKLRA